MGTCNILMYSHDTYGLGHIRRTMAIASHLRDSNTNILILTGSPIVGRYSLPDNIDFVRIPGMIKMTNEEYQPLSIKINPQHALDIRKNIIKVTAKTFQPQLFIVDKEPLGLKKEVLPTLKWIKRSLPGTRTILGLRDIMDESSVTRKDWEDKGIYDILDDLYDEIWVYGRQEIYDPIQEYDIPEPLSHKITFTGYIPRKIPEKKAVRKIRKKQGLTNGEKLVVVTTGGGGDGYLLMDRFMTMLESLPEPLPFKTIFISGPFMPSKEKDDLITRARRLTGVKAWNFYRRMEHILAAADLVVGMGGYNTVCEVLTLGIPTLLIPREVPRKEQLIRAQVLSSLSLVEYIPWQSLNTPRLHQKVMDMLSRPGPYREAMSRFPLTGLNVMSECLAPFRNGLP